ARAASGIGKVESGNRQQADGSMIEWQLTDPYVMPMNGAIPFLIDWGNTPHPAQTAPTAGKLTSLRIEHPHPCRVRAALSALQAEVDVVKAVKFRLSANIQTAGGAIVLV
ncbi:MAG: VOC family protein, partial [Woeseiaceae bacterium]